MDESSGKNIQQLLDNADRAFDRTRFSEAADLAREAMRAAEESGEAVLESLARAKRGSALVQLGLYQKGLSELQDAVQSLIALQEEASGRQAYNYIAIAYEELGDLEKALEQYGRALELARLEGDIELEARVLANIGDAYVRIDQPDKATEYLTAAVPRLVNAGRHALAGWAEAGLARACILREEFDDADYWFHKALKHAEMGKALRCKGEVLTAFGNYLTQLGRHQEAIERLTEALAIAEELSVRWSIAEANLGLADAFEATGDAESALEHFKEYHRVHHLMVDEIARLKVTNLSAEIDLQKARYDREISYIKSVELAEALDELEQRKAQLERLSIRDPLTGAFNRRYLDQCLVREFKRATRHQRPMCLVMADADRFKQINDRYSHNVGDYVLAMVVEIMSSQIRSEDVLARFGGEEFVLLLPHTNIDGAVAACEKIRQSIETYPWHKTEEGLTVTMSFGVASSEGHDDWHEVLSEADRRLYLAKDNGRNRVEPPPDSVNSSDA
ncbi:MAG: diguanylate cyclase [Xanthomonadales bacterium]|nr:diguanylate cyclase [Xanthomonadales bacterium]